MSICLSHWIFCFYYLLNRRPYCAGGNILISFQIFHQILDFLSFSLHFLSFAALPTKEKLLASITVEKVRPTPKNCNFCLMPHKIHSRLKIVSFWNVWIWAERTMYELKIRLIYLMWFGPIESHNNYDFNCLIAYKNTI